MTKYFLLFGWILTVASCSRCKEDCTDSTNPDCPNYVAPTPVDPCASKSEVSADFIIEQLYDYDPEAMFQEVTNVVCTSIQAGTSLINLRPVMTGLSYKWIIGIDTVESETYSFVFSESQCGQVFPLELIVSGEADTNCFPLDNGMDTVLKMVRVVPFTEQELYGEYRVSDVSAPTDSFDVAVLIHEILSSGFQLRLVGFANSCVDDTCRFIPFAYAYNFVNIWSSTSDCGALRGSFWLNDEGLFEADYTWQSCVDNIRRSRRLKGRRLN